MPTTTFPPALAPLPDSSSSTSALYLRLGFLEDLLSLPSGSQSQSHQSLSLTSGENTFNTEGSDGDEQQGPRPGRDLTSRLESLERGLQDLIRGSGSGSGKEGLRRFVDRFDSIQVLLRHVPDPRTSTSTSIASTTTIPTADIANGQPGTSIDPNLDPSPSSTTTTTTSISSETKLSLVLPSTQTLLAIPAQYTALRALLDRGVDGAGELDRYFSGPPRGSSSRKVGGAAGEVPADSKEKEEKVENEKEEVVDVGQRIRAIRRTLDVRNFGTPPSVPQGTQSARPVVEETTRPAGAEEGGARAENLRRVGEVLGRWDAFIKDSSQIFLNLHQTMTDVERAVERAERVRGIKV